MAGGSDRTGGDRPERYVWERYDKATEAAQWRAQ